MTPELIALLKVIRKGIREGLVEDHTPVMMNYDQAKYYRLAAEANEDPINSPQTQARKDFWSHYNEAVSMWKKADWFWNMPCYFADVDEPLSQAHQETADKEVESFIKYARSAYKKALVLLDDCGDAVQESYLEALEAITNRLYAEHFNAEDEEEEENNEINNEIIQ
jgi:hypothetical protein